MNIVYTFDDGYAAITAVSLLSLLESNKEVDRINIIIVDCGISEKNKDKFDMLVQGYNRSLIFVNGKNMESKIPIQLDLLYWSFVCYIRLFFSELLPDFDKVLHVDCDTIIKNKLDSIYDMDLGHNLCAACFDCLPTSKYAAGMKEAEKYYSNGIILFDLKAMRGESVQKQFIDYIVKKEGKLPHLDQDVLNVVLKNRILTLPPEYNLMTQNVLFGDKSCDFFENEPYYTKSEMINGLHSPVMIHLVGYNYVSKPWAQPCYHPYNGEWLNYYNTMGFDEEKKLIKFKPKKYGFIRELVCFVWNVGYKIPFIKNIEFKLEKNRVRKVCKTNL